LDIVHFLFLDIDFFPLFYFARKKFLACKPAAVRGIELDEALYDSQWLAEEDWTNRLHAAGKRLLIHRNLGLLVPSAGDPAHFGITQGQKQWLARLQLDPLALTIRNYDSISAPVPDAAAGPIRSYTHTLSSARCERLAPPAGHSSRTHQKTWPQARIALGLAS
jgi:hypothetical protein